MTGLVEEGSELMNEDAAEGVLDAGLIAAAQKVEHYEIATYGTLIAWAKTLGHKQIAGLLATTLREEEATDKKLTKLAADLNAKAAREPDEDELAEQNKGLFSKVAEAVGMS